MSPRILGYAVLVYAALTSGTVLHLVRFTLGQWKDGWWALGDSALWLAFVAGGFWVIFWGAWGRLVLLVAPAASVAQGLLGAGFLSGFAIPLEAAFFNALLILPPDAKF